MKKILSAILLNLLLLLQLSCASLSTRSVNIPDDLIYQYHLLLVFTPKQDLAVYQQEEDMYVNRVDGLAARDVKVYRLFPNGGLNPENKKLNVAQVLNLRRKYAVQDDQFLNILVGKDGEEKLRKEGMLPPQDLFTFIDTLYVE